jgi:Sulfotransferase family
MSATTESSAAVDEPKTGAPFFIVGSGRCGSTLLRMMLASHTRLTIPPETWFLIPLVKRFGIDRPLSGHEIEGAVAIITGHYRWPDMQMDAQEFRREVSQLTKPCVRDLVEVVYRRHLAAEGKARWGDKTPVYIEIVPELARMYPGSRFVHLVRDGRDVAKSFKVTGWDSGGRWLHDNTREWIKALRFHWRWNRSELRDRILLVRYEDLLLEMEPTLRRICTFIGEQFEPQMLTWEDKVDEQVPAREQVRHTKLKQRIGSEGVARWKREMSAREVFICEAFMGTHLARLGYERRYPSPLWAPAFGLTRLYCRTVLPAIQFQTRVVRFLRKRLAVLLGAT